MPLIIAFTAGVFLFTLGRSTNEKTPVVYVDKAGEVTTKSVQKPILVVETEDGIMVRSGRKVEPYVNPTAPFRYDSFGIVVDCKVDCDE